MKKQKRKLEKSINKKPLKFDKKRGKKPIIHCFGKKFLKSS